jgi:hypothetical protein
VAHVSGAREGARAVTTPGGAARPVATPPAPAPTLARRLALRLGHEWLPRAAWTMGRTGRAGLVGIALLVAAALFLFSTHLEVAAEVDALRSELAATQGRARTASADGVAHPGAAPLALPARTDMPAMLRQLFGEALQARLAVDTGKYQVKETRSGGVVRYQVAFPLTGPYPQIRAFIDATLATMPAVALSDLVLERKSIADGSVEAQIGMTVYTVAPGAIGPPGPEPATAGPGRPPSPRGAATAAQPAGAPAQPIALPRGAEARPAAHRVVAPTQAAALFAQHSWLVLPPLPRLPPPPPPPPPPEPTAPPLPYNLVGSFAPQGDPPVFFLAHGDRMIDARVGDRLDGVYQLESAAGGQLVFVYLPLNVRQNLSAGGSR